MASRDPDPLQKLQRICRERGIPLTNQRRAVLEAVLQRSDHPTADQVYQSVQQRLPQVSRRTVYRVLDALVELGLVRRVHHPGAAVRFDGMMQRHHHLICIHCNRILDMESSVLDRIALPKGNPGGFEICDFSVQLMGTCGQCRKKKP